MDVHLFRNSIGRDARQNRRQTRFVRASLPEKKGHAETFSFHLFKLFSMRHIGRLKSPEYWMQNDAVQCFTTIRVVHFFVRGPCTTLWHTERLRRNTPRCGDEKRKQSRISLIYRIIYLPLRRSAAQKRRPIRPPMSGKRDSNPRPSAWEADALPLSYSRIACRFSMEKLRKQDKSNKKTANLQLVSHFYGASPEKKSESIVWCYLVVPFLRVESVSRHIIFVRCRGLSGRGVRRPAVATGRSDAVKFLPDGCSCSGSGRAAGSCAAGFAGKPNGDEPQRSVPVFR